MKWYRKFLLKRRIRRRIEWLKERSCVCPVSDHTYWSCKGAREVRKLRKLEGRKDDSDPRGLQEFWGWYARNYLRRTLV